jgi:hypothetical protein
MVPKHHTERCFRNLTGVKSVTSRTKQGILLEDVYKLNCIQISVSTVRVETTTEYKQNPSRKPKH